MRYEKTELEYSTSRADGDGDKGRVSGMHLSTLSTGEKMYMLFWWDV